MKKRYEKRIMQLSEDEEKVYQDACKALKEYDKLKESRKKTPIMEQRYRANLMIKELGKGLKRGDKFYRQSTDQQLTTLLDIIQALTEDDLIFKPAERFVGLGG